MFDYYLILNVMEFQRIYTLSSYDMSVNSTMLLFGNIYSSLTLSSPIGISSLPESFFANLLLPISVLLIRIFKYLLLFPCPSISSVFIKLNPFSLFCVLMQWHEFLEGTFRVSVGAKFIDFLVEYPLLSFVDRNDNIRVLYDWPS